MCTSLPQLPIFSATRNLVQRPADPSIVSLQRDFSYSPQGWPELLLLLQLLQVAHIKTIIFGIGITLWRVHYLRRQAGVMAAQLLLKLPLECEQYVSSVPLSYYVPLLSCSTPSLCTTCGQITVQEDCPSVKMPSHLSSPLFIQIFPFSDLSLLTSAPGASVIPALLVLNACPTQCSERIRILRLTRCGKCLQTHIYVLYPLPTTN